MRRTPVLLVLLAAVDLGVLAHAGSRVSGFAPGSLREVRGRVTEYAVPTPQYAHEPAAAPDGSVWITVMAADKLARLDPATGKWTEFSLRPASRPHGLAVDAAGQVWFTANGAGYVGRLDPAPGSG